MYNDRWPVKTPFWEGLFPGLEGRLGLFHYLQWIIKTLCKRHADYHNAIDQLLSAVYFYNQQDLEKLLVALKAGTLGKKYSEQEIADIKGTKYWRQRYSKHLRKEIRMANIMRQLLDEWFARFKCTSSGECCACGRLDPTTNETLFTSDTKPAALNCKDKAEYLQDPLPLDEMYDIIRPNSNSPHGLNIYLSRRGECGMHQSLADNLNLTGTARYNISIRHDLLLATQPDSRNSYMPSGWEGVVSYYNHSELQYLNRLAKDAGLTNLPFPLAESLPEDSGERFFSEYLASLIAAERNNNRSYDANDFCLCDLCSPQAVAATVAQQLLPPPPPPRQPQPPPQPPRQQPTPP